MIGAPGADRCVRRARLQAPGAFHASRRSPVNDRKPRARRALPAAALLAALFSLGAACTPPVDAATLRWAGRGDMQTTDPHSQNEILTNNINILVYETLVTRDKKLAIVPALGESWSQVDPTTWRFKLRPSVRFHDGTPFTADDVVFSFERARADTSQLRVYSNASGVPKRIDDLTVEFTTSGPNPIELEHIANINIMSRAWCEKNKAVKPQNYTQKEDMITAHAANGTGPYILKSREPDVRTVLAKNPDWWGIRNGLFEGNVDLVVYLPIVSDATRVAALISGEVDLVNDPPPQDVPRLKETPGIRIMEGAENRVVFIGMDQKRDELQYSNIKGRNPFKDKRVRQALYQSIDIEAIRERTMRGLSQPTGAMLPSPAQSTPELEKRLPFDKARAKQLLSEAGYPNGFEVTLDCPNNRYVNDEKICQALAAMWAQVGITVTLNTMPRANYFPKLEKFDTSLYMLGWGGGATDAIFILQPVLSTWNGKGDGDYNYGRYSNPRLDEIIARVKVDMNPADRLREIHEALGVQAAEINHLPLHRQMIPWAARTSVTAVHRADNQVMPFWVTVK
jgi:peptide/nickel transport system substrate-binding protein